MMGRKADVNFMTDETNRIIFRLTAERKEQLDEIRKRREISLDSLVLQILLDWAERQCKEVDKHGS